MASLFDLHYAVTHFKRRFLLDSSNMTLQPQLQELIAVGTQVAEIAFHVIYHAASTPERR
jgi:hypothetical protein